MAAAEQARYWIALFGEGGEKAGIQRALGRHKELKAARSVFRRLSVGIKAGSSCYVIERLIGPQ